VHILLLILSNLLRPCVYFDVYLGLTLISYAASVISNGFMRLVNRFSLFSFKATFLGLLGILMMLSWKQITLRCSKSSIYINAIKMCHERARERERERAWMLETVFKLETEIELCTGWIGVCRTVMLSDVEIIARLLVVSEEEIHSYVCAAHLSSVHSSVIQMSLAVLFVYFV
jgi:hypothetical protein